MSRDLSVIFGFDVFIMLSFLRTSQYGGSEVITKVRVMGERVQRFNVKVTVD